MKRLFRPWPLLPTASWIIIFLFVEVQNLYFGVLAPQYAVCRLSCATIPDFVIPLLSSSESSLNKVPHDVLGNLINSAATASAVALVLYLAQRLRKKDTVQTGLGYLTVLLLASIAGAVARLTVLPLKVDKVPLESIPAIGARYFILVSVAHMLLGLNTERYREAMYAARDAERDAKSALSRLQEQQSLVVEADEKVRREIANFLHDRVQAGLLVAAMQVRNAIDSAPDQTKELLVPAMNDLEKLRVEDVRAAGRRLSPDLNAVGLDSALRDLARSWSAAMKVAIDFPPATVEALNRLPDVTVATAIYRTVEQALLNAAAHGHAENVEVEVSVSNSSLLLMIRDNGVGLADESAPGSGSALIDAWMSAANGRWRLNNRDTGGCALSAEIPLT